MPHELAGAAFARHRLGERAAWVIAQHVPAKRYLVATDPAHHGLLSPVSVASLKVQGGPMDEGEAARFAAHPLAADAVALRRWDDAAKDPGGALLPMPALLAAHARCIAARKARQEDAGEDPDGLNTHERQGSRLGPTWSQPR